MKSLKENPYQVFSHDHTGQSRQMRNLAYLCWKLCTDVMGDHSLTSYAGFKSGGIPYMIEIDKVVADYKSHLSDDMDMDSLQVPPAELSTVYDDVGIAEHFVKQV